ncbi:MAG: hypothetical protein KDC79_05435 [Cyclobacteriaceae bacterium]|nr:hypothetical protein [Cyclobacteriaceae bacterium]
MDSSQIHLLVNHIPITGVLIGLFVLIAGLSFKKDLVKITALGIFIFSGLTAILAQLTGEGAEKLAKKAGNFSETMIHMHEEYSRAFFAIVVILSFTAIVTYYLQLKKKRKLFYMYIVVLILAIGSAFVGYTVSNSGRQIHHPEIRNSKDVIDVTLR